MKYELRQKLEIAAFALVGLNFLIVVLHSVAHEILFVKATPAQLAFIVPVIIIAPVAAGFVLLKFKKAGAALLLFSMLGSFLFGLYYHFIADTIDHVGHVVHLEPAFWATMFEATAYLLLALELLGSIIGFWLLSQTLAFKNYAARTDF